MIQSKHTTLAAIFLLFALAGCQVSAPRAAAPAADHHVILITIDGFAAYLLDDPQVSIPTLRSLIAQGVVAQGSQVINPSVTWPNHTTMLTGVRADAHSCFFNGVLERGGPGKPVNVQPNHDQSALIAVPTIFDVLHEKGRGTAAVNWPCLRNSKSVDDNLPDVPDALKHTTPRLRDKLIADGQLIDASTESFRAIGSVRRDDVWAAAVFTILKERKPALLAWHILNTDGVHHAYGPKTNAGYSALAVADMKIRQLLDTLDAAGMRDNTTLIITADHGFARATKMVSPNVVLRQNNLLTANATAVIAAKAMIVSEGGTALLYITDPATPDAERKKIADLMRGLEGVERLIEPAGYGELGFPDPKTNPQSPDMVLVGKDGYAFSGTATGDDVVYEPVMGRHSVGHHGYISSDPKMQAIFIASGKGIKKAEKIGMIQNIDIAPTIARLLGVELKSAAGKPLVEILEK